MKNLFVVLILTSIISSSFAFFLPPELLDEEVVVGDINGEGCE